MFEQLKQLITPVWDGNLICKSHRDKLLKKGYIKKYEGWNYLTKKGIVFLVDMGELKQ